jgi:hypothetical protein
VADGCWLHIICPPEQHFDISQLGHHPDGSTVQRNPEHGDDAQLRISVYKG